MTAVRDIMHRGLIACASDTQLPQVAGLLRKHRIHAVVVIDDQNRALGVVSETDLLVSEWFGSGAENLAILQRMTAAELMTHPAATIPSAATAKDAAAALRGQHVARLLVTEGQEPIGVVSISDLLAALPQDVAQRDRVRDVMSWGYVACRPATLVKDAVRAMLERDSRSLMVIGEGGRLVGVVTGFDLLASLTGEAEVASTVADFMHVPITVTPDASLKDAVDLMLTKSIHRLVVVDPEDPVGPPLGLISTTDIVVEIASPGSAWTATDSD